MHITSYYSTPSCSQSTNTIGYSKQIQALTKTVWMIKICTHNSTPSNKSSNNHIIKQQPRSCRQRLHTKGWSLRHAFRSSERRPTAIPDMTSIRQWPATLCQSCTTLHKQHMSIWTYTLHDISAQSLVCFVTYTKNRIGPIQYFPDQRDWQFITGLVLRLV